MVMDDLQTAMSCHNEWCQSGAAETWNAWFRSFALMNVAALVAALIAALAWCRLTGRTASTSGMVVVAAVATVPVVAALVASGISLLSTLDNIDRIR